MLADVRLSTRFLTTQNAHQVGMLVTLSGSARVQRPPINVALVIDRSGSMAGGPLAAAREAALEFTRFLSPEDRLSIVAFDDGVETLFGPASPSDPAVEAAIGSLSTRGTTNLSGGWLSGMHLVREGLVEGTNRVVLLTDGQANRGITDTDRLVAMSAGALRERVSTTCIGFGASFNEDLLEPMARQGGGNYWFVEEQDQMGPIFQSEIDGLVALAAQNVEVEVALTHPQVAGVSFLQSYDVRTTDEGAWRVALGDLYATSPRPLGLLFHVENVGALGPVQLGEVRIEADVVTEAGIEHRSVVMPVMANLDAEAHVEPVVERTLLRFRAAQAREAANRHADAGEFDRAAALLREAGASLMPYAAQPGIQGEIEDLDAQVERLHRRQYDAMDRKYSAAWAMGVREGKHEYLERIRRRKP